MKSRTTRRFRQCLARLPERVQQQAYDAYQRFLQNQHHPGLQFKRVHTVQPIYSARISIDYRALAIVDGDVAIWFWIGVHAKYERLLAQL